MTEEYQQKDWREACCIEVLLPRAPVASSPGTFPRGSDPCHPGGPEAGRRSHRPRPGNETCQGVGKPPGFNVRKVVREKIVKTTYNDVVMEERDPLPSVWRDQNPAPQGPACASTKELKSENDWVQYPSLEK